MSGAQEPKYVLVPICLSDDQLFDMFPLTAGKGYAARDFAERYEEAVKMFGLPVEQSDD